jgi:hypothetical protein
VEPVGQAGHHGFSIGTLAKELHCVQSVDIELIVNRLNPNFYTRQNLFRIRLFTLKFGYGFSKIRFSNSYGLE